MPDVGRGEGLGGGGWVALGFMCIVKGSLELLVTPFRRSLCCLGGRGYGAEWVSCLWGATLSV
jgi:hypothetical protein